MRILVTGGAGFIGSHLVDLLIEKKHEVIVIDNLSSGKLKNLNLKAKLYTKDLLDFESIKKIFEETKPEIVHHLAAQTNLRKSIIKPLEDANINIISTINLLELCKDFKVKRFIFSSSGAVYGNTKELPVDESQRENPISPYGCSKLAIEKYLKYYGSVHNLGYTILRYSNVYGPRQNPNVEAGVVSIFLKNMISGKNPTIFGGIQTRDFVFVKDVVNANFLAQEDTKNETYNVSTEKETDIIEIFSELNKFFKNKFEAIYEKIKEGEVTRSCLKNSKIEKDLKWRPITDLKTGLQNTYHYSLNKNFSD